MGFTIKIQHRRYTEIDIDSLEFNSIGGVSECLGTVIDGEGYTARFHYLCGAFSINGSEEPEIKKFIEEIDINPFRSKPNKHLQLITAAIILIAVIRIALWVV